MLLDALRNIETRVTWRRSARGWGGGSQPVMRTSPTWVQTWEGMAKSGRAGRKYSWRGLRSAQWRPPCGWYGRTGKQRVWRKVEVALVEQQSGEIQEGFAGGRGVWRVKAQSLVEAVEEWLASNASATHQAVRDLEGGVEPSVPLQNPVELVVLSLLPGRRRCWRLTRGGQPVR